MKDTINAAIRGAQSTAQPIIIPDGVLLSFAARITLSI